MDDEPLPKSQCVYESDISPKMGSFLEGKTINFKHVKLVNTKQDKHDANELNRDQHNPVSGLTRLSRRFYGVGGRMS